MLELEPELLGVLPLLLELPELLLVGELVELPLWLEFPLDVPPCPGLVLLLPPGVSLDELPLVLLVSELDPAPCRLERELEELSGVAIRGVLAEELAGAELSLELEPALPVAPRSAWLHPIKRAAATATTGIMNRFIIFQTSYFNKLTPPTFMQSAFSTTQVITLVRWRTRLDLFK
ncbi:MAG: hypothetical protein JWM16_6007 [Verrucomicrobiales bacterium]|nr:hypothetical protein [Verrucomicrobiales bacterium]